MFISVVVPTYNRRADLVRCLMALRNQTYPKNSFEVVVVEDGSLTDVGDFVRSLGRNFTYFWQDHKGPAAARNQGIEKARGETVAFTDDDCAAPHDWLAKLADGYWRHPAVAGVGGFMEAPEEVLAVNPFARYESFITRQVYGAGEKEVLGGFEVPTGGTNNISYKKELLSRVGGFDEAFPVAAGEDADLKKRICDLGYALLYLPLKVEHYHRYSLSSFLKQGKDRGLGSLYFQAKHGGGLGRLQLAQRISLLPLGLFRDFLAAHLPLETAFLKMVGGFFDYSTQFLNYGKFRKEED